MGTYQLIFLNWVLSSIFSVLKIRVDYNFYSFSKNKMYILKKIQEKILFKHFFLNKKRFHSRIKSDGGQSMENLKKMAGIKAAEFVKDGMVVGLGTGSTAYYFVEEIGRRIKEEGLQITAVTTSSVTSKQAEGLNIPLKSIDQVYLVDVTVDGADEVDSQFNGIKGGGGALLMEKVVATPSKEYIWVVDESKLVDKLGAFKLPVEVVQYGAEQVFRRFERAGYKPSFREKDGQRFVTDMQNFIIDLALDVIEDPIAFGQELDHVVGVVEHGLFNQMVDKVIVAGRDGVQILTSTKAN